MEPKTVHFVNLTSGIEIMPDAECSFIRIRSADCEMKCWGALLREADHNFLMCLALGHKCIVYDCGLTLVESRAVRWGFQWIRYALEMAWFGHTDVKPIPKGPWDQYWRELTKQPSHQRTLEKLRYFRSFLNTDHLDLEFVCAKAKHDDDRQWQGRKLREWMNNVIEIHEETSQVERTSET